LTIVSHQEIDMSDNQHSTIFVGGAWVQPSGKGTIAVVNPATELVVGAIPACNANDAGAAVAAARSAFDNGPWPRMKGGERANMLRRIAQGIRDKAALLARLETLDNGKPLPEAEWDIADMSGTFDYYADMAEASDTTPPEVIALADERFTAEVVKEPLGVVAAITPWNYPALMASWKLAPALAAGCTVVLKPSEFTSLTTLALAEISREAGLPAGVLNLVTGTGPDVGQTLVDHPSVDKVSFTGSVPTGSRIMAACAADIKKVSLELGGKSAMLLFDDADIENAVEWILFGIFWNQGQACSATSRLLIDASVHDAVVERLIVEARKIRIGDGFAEGTQMGPLASEIHYRKVIAAIDQARADGATVPTGGKRPAGFDKGYFIEPTILTDVPLDSAAWCEEIFGPVLCVRPFSSEEEAIRLANDSRFGLASAVMTRDGHRAARVANALRAGVAWINCSQPAFCETPWGGYKQSGIGREMGRWGFENYQETKQIMRFADGERWGWYLK